MASIEPGVLDPPADYAALKAHISTHAPRLPKRLQQCARFALDNPDALALGTAASVARAAGVQASTLVRFAQAMGFTGFSDMQEVFRDNLLVRSQGFEGARVRLDASVPETTEELLASFSGSTQAATATMVSELDVSAFDRAAIRLAQAETLHLLGLRRSFPVASYLFYAFAKIGKRTTLLDFLGGMLADRTDTIAEQDVLLACTFHPYAPEVAEFVEAVKESGRTVIALTDTSMSPVEPIADEVLFVRDGQVGSFRSLSATMCLAAALVAAVAARTRALPT